MYRTKKFRMVSLFTAVLASATIAVGCSATPSENTDGKTAITIWDQKGGDPSAAVDKLVEDFNAAQSKVTVKRQFIAGNEEQYASQIQNAIRSGDMPNLIFGDSNSVRLGSLLKSEAVVPLEDYLGTGDYKVEAKDFPEALLDPSTYDDKLYALPTDAGDFSLIYNTKLFEEAGITEAPKTWDDVVADAKKLTGNDRYGIYLPIGSSEWTTYTWLAMLGSAGGEFLTEDNTAAAFNTPEGVAALKAWTDMISAGTAYPSSLDDDSQQTGVPGLIAGQVAMLIGRPGDLPTLDEAMGEGAVDVAPLPYIDAPAMTTGLNASYILDNGQAENDAAWAFLSWAVQADQQAEWDISTGYLPTSNLTADSPQWKKHVESDPRLKVFADQLEYAQTRPAIAEYGEISSALASQIERAMLKQATPEEALSQAEEEVNAALSK